MVTKHLSIIPTLATGKLVLMVECREGESAGQQIEAKQEGFSDLWMARWMLDDSSVCISQRKGVFIILKYQIKICSNYF